MISEFKFQRRSGAADVYVDSNWAGCKTTRKSTSGGAMMVGLHCVKSWAKTQATVALSSGEAELIGTVKGACEGLGLKSLMSDLGLEVRVRMFVDASAALGIIHRQGIGKIRHLDTSVLWLQQKELKAKISFSKIDGTKNCADLMTKHLTLACIEKHIESLSMRFAVGRAAVTSKVHHFAAGVSVRQGAPR